MKGESRISHNIIGKPVKEQRKFYVEMESGDLREVSQEDFYMMAEFDLMFFQSNIVEKEGKIILKWAL